MKTKANSLEKGREKENVRLLVSGGPWERRNGV